MDNHHNTHGKNQNTFFERTNIYIYIVNIVYMRF